MKRETIIKIILMLIIGCILFVKPLEIFAADESSDAIDSFFGSTGENNTTNGTENEEMENLGGLDDLDPKPEQTPTPTPEPETTPAPEKVETTQKQEEKLPDAGLAEDTMLFVSIAVLGVISIYAYKKVNEYKNI